MAGRARLALITGYLEIQNFPKALTAAQEALSTDPDNPAFLEAMGRSQYASKQYKQAAGSFERLTTLRPQDAKTLLLLADSYLAVSDKEKALEVVQNALRIQPDLLAAQLGLIRMYVADGRRDEALAIARQIQKQRPKEPAGYKAEGDLLYAIQRFEDARSVMERGFRITASSTLIPHLHLVLLRLHRETDAQALANKWIKENPEDLEVRAYLAQHALEAKDYGTAIRLYREVVAIQPTMPFVLSNLAWALQQTNDNAALEYAERANQLLPGHPLIMDTLGWILVERGDLGRGLPLLQQAAALTPDTFTVRLHFAKALIRAGQVAAARKEVESLTNGVKDVEGSAELAELRKQL